MPFVPFSSTMEEELEIGCILSSDSLLAEKEIHELIDQLPKGYGRVFRMSVIEGYSHQEIAEKLSHIVLLLNCQGQRLCYVR